MTQRTLLLRTNCWGIRWERSDRCVCTLRVWSKVCAIRRLCLNLDVSEQQFLKTVFTEIFHFCQNIRILENCFNFTVIFYFGTNVPAATSALFMTFLTETNFKIHFIVWSHWTHSKFVSFWRLTTLTWMRGLCVSMILGAMMSGCTASGRGLPRKTGPRWGTRQRALLQLDRGGDPTCRGLKWSLVQFVKSAPEPPLVHGIEFPQEGGRSQPHR